MNAGDFAGRRIVDVPPRSEHVAPHPTEQHWAVSGTPMWKRFGYASQAEYTDSLNADPDCDL